MIAAMIEAEREAGGNRARPKLVRRRSDRAATK